MEKKRLKSIDVAKGLGIIGVCLFHAVGPNGIADYSRVVQGFFACFFSGVLYVFFFLSGYFYKPGRDYTSRVKHRVKTLLLPALYLNVVTCIIGYFAEWIFAERIALTDCLLAFLRNIIDPFSFQTFGSLRLPENRIGFFFLPTWFLFRLFFSELIFYAVADFALKKWIRTFYTAAGLLSVTALYLRFMPGHFIFQINSCFAFAAVLLMGAFCGKGKLLEKLENGYRSITYWLVLAGASVLLLFRMLFFAAYGDYDVAFGYFSSAMTNGLETVYLWFICDFISGYMFLFLCVWIARLPGIGSLLKYCGERTIYILALHAVFESITVRCFGADHDIGYFYFSVVAEKPILILSAAVSLAVCCGVQILNQKLKEMTQSGKTAGIA